MLAWLAYLGPSPAQAATVEVTVSLYRVVELSCDEGAGESCGNDYYPKFKIGNEALYDGEDDYCCAHGPDFRTNWVHKAKVDTSQNPVDIHLELWDQDDLSQNNVIHWAKNGDYLDLKFDLDTCVFTGGGLTAEQGAGALTLSGESETTGPDSARGFFTITTPACITLARTTGGAADSDGDGIMNAWETPGVGYDVNNDNHVDLALGDPPYNALPYRKDLFVEADYMKDNEPDWFGLGDVVDAFARAPVDPYHPDPAHPAATKYLGVTLHVLKDEELPKTSNIRFERSDPVLVDFNELKNGEPAGPCTGHFGTLADRNDGNCANILKAKRDVYRYMIFAESYLEDPDSSGNSEWYAVGPQGGNDFIVTLGTWGVQAINDVGGLRAAQASTFMHELGHTLSLGHGGDEEVNCKPNYLSVMNYALQFPDIDLTRPMDYSSTAAGTALGTTDATRLVEKHLNENLGVRGTPHPDRSTVYGIKGKPHVEPAGSGPIDWNGEKGNTEGDIPADLNYIESIGLPGKGCNIPDDTQTLHGYDDWAHLQYNPRLNADGFNDGVPRSTLHEMTEAMVLALSQQADLKVTKSADQAEADGGDTVTYTVDVTDLGPGKATAVSLADTLPDGTTRQRPVPDLNKDDVHTVTPKFAYQVPCDTTDGTVLTNTVTVTGKDTNGVPDPYTSDNTARATTTVRAPVMTVNETATATVNAGEAITYTLAYANTGGGGASDAVVTGTLPAGVYYSKALDLGAGPKPDSVTLNADGTRTLVWNVGALPARSGERTIVFTARPTLLATAGTAYAGEVSVTYKNTGGACTFDPVSDSATTTVTAVPPTRDPLSKGYWKNHSGQWTAEYLARIQATDQRYDGDRSGALSAAEIDSAFHDANGPKTVLREHALGTYFNLATRRVNAGTAIDSATTRRLGLGTVRAAMIYAQETMALPIDSGTSARYSDIIGVLDDVNANKIEVY
ncbi:hypothetical protein ABT158_22945 [Nonomuraea sp. NPDC001636]|uniref:hypothetical protein n=1 Tax=Nonomuraea sp. NPDC001636 TaxID=3154391 RepID=UPI00331B56DB